MEAYICLETRPVETTYWINVGEEIQSIDANAIYAKMSTFVLNYYMS